MTFSFQKVPARSGPKLFVFFFTKVQMREGPLLYVSLGHWKLGYIKSMGLGFFLGIPFKYIL